MSFSLRRRHGNGRISTLTLFHGTPVFRVDLQRGQFDRQYLARVHVNVPVVSTSEDCMRYRAARQTVGLSQYPILAIEASRTDAACDSLAGNGARAAREYLAFSRALAGKSADLAALQYAVIDSAGAVMPYLRETLRENAQDQAIVVEDCHSGEWPLLHASPEIAGRITVALRALCRENAA